MESTYVKLPALDVLPGIFVGDHDDELRYLASHHPLVKLRHDLLDVGLDLVVGGNWHDQLMSGGLHAGVLFLGSEAGPTKHIQAIFLDTIGYMSDVRTTTHLLED